MHQNKRIFLISFFSSFFIALVNNLLPYFLTRHAYTGDGVEWAGNPRPFYQHYGRSLSPGPHYYAGALFFDILLALIIAFIIGLVFSRIFILREAESAASQISVMKSLGKKGMVFGFCASLLTTLSSFITPYLCGVSKYPIAFGQPYIFFQYPPVYGSVPEYFFPELFFKDILFALFLSLFVGGVVGNLFPRMIQKKGTA